jgi:Uma2 family endonuclease
MSMATTILDSTRETAGGQCVEFPAIGWKGYVTLLRLRGERPTPRMVYLDGTVWLMSPTFAHERMKRRLGQFVTEVVVGLRIPCISAGSTTFRRRAKRGGVEGDETFYLANEAQIRGKDRISLRTDPPPDLAIEAVYSHDAEAALKVYRRLRVPEVWICNESELVILVLQPNGRYAVSSTSASFPFLSAAEIHDWVRRPETGSDTEWILELRRWVRRTLKPRVRRQAKGSG